MPHFFVFVKAQCTGLIRNDLSSDLSHTVKSGNRQVLLF